MCVQKELQSSVDLDLLWEADSEVARMCSRKNSIKIYCRSICIVIVSIWRTPKTRRRRPKIGPHANRPRTIARSLFHSLWNMFRAFSVADAHVDKPSRLQNRDKNVDELEAQLDLFTRLESRDSLRSDAIPAVLAL